MTRPRFLADHDYDEDILDGLLRHQPDIDVVLAREVEMSRSPDPEFLDYAAREGRIVLSHDRNTLIGHAYQRLTAGLPMPGLFVSRQRVIGPLVGDLLTIWGASEAYEWEGMIVYLPLDARR